MATGHMWQLEVRGRLFEQQTINVLHYVELLPNPAGTAEDLALTFRTNVMPSWYDAVSTEWKHVGVRAQKVWPDLGPFDQIPGIAPFQGELLGDALPSTVAAVFTKRTDTPRARGRGRTYIAGLPETGQSNSVIAAAQMLLLETLRDNLAEELVGGEANYLPIILSNSAVPPEIAPVTRPITRIEIQDILGTQRRRRIGTGA